MRTPTPLRGFAAVPQRAAPGVLAALCLGAVLAGCGGGGDTSTTSAAGGAVASSLANPTAPPAPIATPGTLPFHFDGAGQGGSPPFTVAAAGDYQVAWTASGIAGGSACTVSIGLSASATSVTVVDGVQIAPSDKKSGATKVHLDATSYRAVEGGGCGWSITVSAG
jgi:hypothetical protein